MAKAKHWEIPFQSLKGVNYRIDIYDNYTGSVPSTWPIQLEPGDSPIITEENKSENFFEPIRETTGSISVVDRDGTLKEQMMSSDNTHHPVILVRIDSNNNETIEWQGFMNCEEFEQDYSSTAQVISFNINGVLEAMDSMQYQSEDIDGYISIKDVISKALTRAVSEGGKLANNDDIITFGNIYYPVVNRELLNKYIDPTTLISIDEQDTEQGITYIDNGDSFKSILEMICTYAGWCVRFDGNNVYFISNGHQDSDNKQLQYETYSVFTTNSQIASGATPVSVSSVNISSLSWRGNEHTRSFAQGAKAVEVVTNLELYKIDLDLPACPVYNLSEKIFTVSSNPNNPWRPTVWINMLHTFDPLLSFQASSVDINVEPYSPSDQYVRLNGMTNLTDTINNYIREDFRENFYQYAVGSPGGYTVQNVHNMAFLAKILDNDEYKDALCILGTIANDGAYAETANSYLFKMKAKDTFISSALSGNIKVSWDDLALSNFTVTSGAAGYITFSLKCGDKYWNGSEWVQQFAYWTQSTIDSDGNKIQSVSIPINVALKGKFELAIYRRVGFYIVNCAILTSLKVSYEANSSILSTRDQNRYIQLLGLNFKDQETVQCHISSDLFNRPSPSLICTDSDGSTRMTTMTYYKSDGTNELRRPERDLLARLAKFYGIVRRRLSIIVEHPTTAALPLLQIDARNNAAGQANAGYDGKLYLPLAESRDWQQDTSTITCFETPDGDE